MATLTPQQQSYLQALAQVGRYVGNAWNDPGMVERMMADDQAQYRRDTEKVNDLLNRASNFQTSPDPRDQQSPEIQRYLAEANELTQRIGTNPIYQGMGLQFTPAKPLTSQEQADRDRASYAQPAAVAPEQVDGQSTPINFKEGLTPEQQAGITKLASKPIDQWTQADKNNWNFATNGQALPGSSTPGVGGSAPGLPGQIQSGMQAGGIDQTGWTDAMKQSYDAMQGYVTQLTEQGKIVNPDIEINAAMTAKFLAQAKTELEPYYGQIFKQAEQDLGKEFTRLTEDYQTKEKQIGEQYGQALESTQESFARRGLAFGSERKDAEKTLATQAEDALANTQRDVMRRATDIGTAGERALGSANFPNRQLSFQTGAAPITGAPGQYGLTGSTQNRTLFAPTGGVTGDVERERLMAETSRQKDLIGTERELRSLNYA